MNGASIEQKMLLYLKQSMFDSLLPHGESLQVNIVQIKQLQF